MDVALEAGAQDPGPAPPLGALHLGLSSPRGFSYFAVPVLGAHPIPRPPPYCPGILEMPSKTLPLTLVHTGLCWDPRFMSGNGGRLVTPFPGPSRLPRVGN